MLQINKILKGHLYEQSSKISSTNSATLSIRHDPSEGVNM